MTSPLSSASLCAAAAVALVAACGNEYRCPAPIGTIVRDDCEAYKTKYESLKVRLGFSFAGLSFGASAGKEKLRDPSELLQVLMLENMALCKDYNACRVPSADYRRRREAADHKFTAAVAIGQQLQGTLDNDSKRRLIEKLIEVISEKSTPQPQPAQAQTGARGFWRRPLAFHPGMFRSATKPWFGSKFMPDRPDLPTGVPVLAAWWIGHGRGVGETTFITFTFWGKTEADDRVHVTFSDPVSSYDAAVKPERNRPKGRARITVRGKLIGGSGTMSLDYKLGATGKKHHLGTFRLDSSVWLDRAYLAYHADPIRKDPVEYERPWIVVYSRVPSATHVSMRCQHNGKKLDTVISGITERLIYSAARLTTHVVPLPVRIGTKGGSERTRWKKSLPDEKPLTDMLAAEGAGKWRCKLKLDSRVARVVDFTLRPDGSVVPSRKPDDGAWPWWPIKVERVQNSVEQKAEGSS